MKELRLPTRWSSLQWRILTGLSLILLVVLIIISASVLFFVRRTEQEAWQGRQEEATLSGAMEVSTFLDHATDGLRFIGNMDRAYVMLITGLDPDTASNLLDSTPALLEVTRIDPAGEVLAAVSQDEPVLGNMPDILQTEWFTTTLTGENYVGSVELTADNQPFTVITIPAVDGGVAASRLDMNALWDMVNDIRFGDTGRAYIVDQDGYIIAHNQTNYVIDRVNIKNRSEINAALNAPGLYWTDSYTNFEGTDVVGTASAIPNTNWVVITEIARAEAYETSTLAAQLLVGGLIVFGILVLALSFWLLRRAVFMPIEQLRAGTEIIAAGNLKYQIPVFRQDEIGLVTRAFNEMVKRLHQRDEQLVAQTYQLSEANQKLEESSRLKSEFLSTMSHELRTPLNAVIGYSGLLLMGITGKIDDEARNSVLSIQESSNHLLGLINDVLDIAKIEAGRMKLISSPVDLPTLVESWKNRIGVLAFTKKLSFVTYTDPTLPQAIYGDEERLTQIAFNLLSNAVKFTDEGSIRLEVSKISEAEWAIQVTDTGVGIPPEALEYIFDEFRQVDGSYNRTHGGTGLGLAIVRKLATAMNGNIKLNSTLGHGSTFIVTLPLQPVLPKIEEVLEHGYT